jgi:hypothetical protein
MKEAMAIGTESANPMDGASLEELLRDLKDIDPDALREAEFEQTRWVLDEMVGKTIASATVEKTRIVIETGDGNRYFFFGFMGSGGHPPKD